jgi:hypothetical protein
MSGSKSVVQIRAPLLAAALAVTFGLGTLAGLTVPRTVGQAAQAAPRTVDQAAQVASDAGTPAAINVPAIPAFNSSAAAVTPGQTFSW